MWIGMICEFGVGSKVSGFRYFMDIVYPKVMMDSGIRNVIRAIIN